MLIHLTLQVLTQLLQTIATIAFDEKTLHDGAVSGWRCNCLCTATLPAGGDTGIVCMVYVRGFARPVCFVCKKETHPEYIRK